jgi:hypothetical protein
VVGRVRVGSAVGGGAPRLGPTAFADAEGFYEFYLAVDEGAEGGAAGADHADGEFKLAVFVGC